MTRSADHAIRKLLVLTYHRLDYFVAPPWFSEKLRTEFPGFQVVQQNTYDGLEQEIIDVEVLFCTSLRPEQFVAAHKLKWIHSQSAAVHQFMFPELVNSNVTLTNSSDVHGVVVAEQVMAMLFALARLVPEAVRFQQKHVWGQEGMWNSHPRPRELAGATLGLVGLGSIGRNLAQRASAIGMRVIAVRENPDKPKPPSVEEVFPTSKLPDLLAQSDYVVLSTPVTPQTTGMIGRKQLSAMKPEACLVNVGRGPLIVEPDLIEALRSEAIGGAALDVFDEEPLPSSSPLWDLDNLLIMPHTGGMSTGMWKRHYAYFSENLRRYLSGEPLLGLVDKQRGY